MNQNKALYRDPAFDNGGPSNVLWNRFRGRDDDARTFFWDFREYIPGLTTGNLQNDLYTYNDGTDLIGTTTPDFGLLMDHAAADNDESYLVGGGNTGAVGSIASSGGKLLAFEASIRKSSVDNDAIAFFCGLAAPGSAVAATLTDDDALLADISAIGFRVLQDDGDSLDVVYRKSGQAIQNVKDALQAVAADTYYKLGILFDPDATASKKVTFYVDGVDTGYYITGTQLAAATFPDGVGLNFLIGSKLGDANAESMGIRWVKFGQIR